MNYHEEYKKWLSYLTVNLPQEAARLIKMTEKEISHIFRGRLRFGTGGLRGYVGWGPSFINTCTIERTTAGFARFIMERPEAKTAAIAYDTRQFSEKFARAAAGVLLGAGMEVWLFPMPAATPLLSYCIRKLGLGWGIVITASHNPKEYNGYKCYDSRGVQILPEDAQKITDYIESGDFFDNRAVPDREIGAHPKFHLLGQGLTDGYLDELYASLPDAALSREHGAELRIVYTPLHGCGALPVKKILQKQGFVNTFFLQMEPDPAFGGLASPNPEEPEAFDRALSLAKSKKAHLILATDPDCDRLGVCVFDKDGFHQLTGNQVAALLTDYLLSTRPPGMGAALVTSIVSGEMAQVIALNRGLKVQKTLTGFKYIGDLAQREELFFGYEESCGYLAGPLSGDKDGVEAAALVAEMALHHLRQGSSLYRRWLALGEKYGFYVEALVNHKLENASALEASGDILDFFAALPPRAFPGLKIERVEDYAKSRWSDFTNGGSGALPFSTNMVKIFFAGQSWAAVRPSGTEAKIKYYFSACAPTLKEAQEKIRELKRQVIGCARSL
ncbi:MAG: phospho-sugar mutase [Clostridiales bacterium]|nr:phospho-sugar mutase [Clostridiales bacterium]